MSTNLQQWLKVFNLLRLLEIRNIGNIVKSVGNSMLEKCKSKHKFGGAKVCKTEQVRKCFENLKFENEVFGLCVNYIICSLDFWNTKGVVLRCTSE